MLLWFGSCDYCILACFLWSKKCEHSSSNHRVFCFIVYRPRHSLAEVFIFCLMFFQALFMSLLSLKFFRAAVLFEILIWYCFLTYSSFSFLRLNLSTSNLCRLFTYCQSFPKFCNHQIVIIITVSSPDGSYVEYTRIPSPIYQYVISLVVSLWSGEVQVYLWMFWCRNITLLTTTFFWCGKVCDSNIIIITILM